jgi:hypothetical protein
MLSSMLFDSPFQFPNASLETHEASSTLNQHSLRHPQITADHHAGCS